MFDLKKRHCAFYWIQMVLESDFHQGEERGKIVFLYKQAFGIYRAVFLKTDDLQKFLYAFFFFLFLELCQRHLGIKKVYYGVPPYGVWKKGTVFIKDNCFGLHTKRIK